MGQAPRRSSSPPSATTMISALGFIFQVKAGKTPHPTLCFPREATVRESPHNLLLWPPGDLRFSHKNKTTRWDDSFHVSSCLQYPIAHLKRIILLTLSLAEYWNSSSAGIHTDNWLDREFILESRPCSSLLLNLVYLTPIQKVLIFNHLEHVLSLYPPLIILTWKTPTSAPPSLQLHRRHPCP